ncbi:hypothetical protein QBC37DRAFT_288270 [Rhypophila decipiens]|uniref:Protein kinase domain-containing protein n=1 Tax=Rhypophila decipiens TaxID=261697 RepID=A0AAN6Y4Z9_9PEZI|nr:hypothetical protein QBC37DRAFT_288270 [Rhypophila decipiens]
MLRLSARETARIVCNLNNLGPSTNSTTEGASSRFSSQDHIPLQGSSTLRRILATLLYISSVGALGYFIRDGICDGDLPITLRGPSDSPRALARGGTVECLKGLSCQVLQLFECHQWKMLAPVFDHNAKKLGHKVAHQRLKSAAVLPFTTYEHACSGTRGEIYRVQIHQDHHNFKKSFNVLRRLKHRHITPLLATYEYLDHFHLVLPWAECNLAVYWNEKFPKPAHDIATVKWIAEQCRGIAAGLDALHHHATTSASTLMMSLDESASQSAQAGFLSRAHSLVTRKDILGATNPARRGEARVHHFFGRHGDIKPLNLLWFPEDKKSPMGIIKISDFGEGEFSSTPQSDLMGAPDATFAYTPSYRPPECDHPHPEMIVITSMYDTWTLGCLFLEFATWYVGGRDLLSRFERSRRTGTSGHNHRGEATFFEITGQENPHARVKKAVREVCLVSPAFSCLIRRTPIAPKEHI